VSDKDIIFDMTIPEKFRIAYYEKMIQNEKMLIAQKEIEKAQKDKEILIAQKEIEKAQKDKEIVIAQKDKEILIAQKDKEILIAQKDKEILIAQKDKEIVIAQKDKETEIEKAKKEKAIVEKELVESITLINTLNRENSLMAPRAVIEFVETFVFSKYGVKGTNRVEKWEYFFTKIDIGQRILQCIVEKIPLWTSKPRTVAERVSDIYRSSSDYHHQTSLEIESTKQLNISESALVKQTFYFICCVAENCGLRLST